MGGSAPCTNASPTIWVGDMRAEGLKREVEKRHEGRRLQPHQVKSKQYAFQHPKMDHSAGESQDKRIIAHNSSKHIVPVKMSVILYRSAPF